MNTFILQNILASASFFEMRYYDKDVSFPVLLLKMFCLPLNFEISAVFACWPVAKTEGISKFSGR